MVNLPKKNFMTMQNLSLQQGLTILVQQKLKQQNTLEKIQHQINDMR